MNRLLYRARGGSADPLNSGEGSRASRGKDEGQDREKSMKTAGYPGDPGLPGLFGPLPLENWGRGSRAHAHRVANPGIPGGGRRD